MCLIMDYYEKKDLKSFLKESRASRVVIDQTLIMKWVGQMVDGLAYVHKNKMIHRLVGKSDTAVVLHTSEVVSAVVGLSHIKTLK